MAPRPRGPCVAVVVDAPARPAACGRRGTRRCGPSPRRGRCGRRRAPHGRGRCRGRRWCAPPTAGRGRCRARSGSSPAPGFCADVRSSGPAPCGTACGVGRHAARPPTRRCAPGSGRARRRSSSAPSSPSSLRMASIWRRSRNSRCWSSRPSRTSLRIFSVELQLGQGLPGPVEDLADPHLDVDGLQQLDLALDGEVGPPAGEVGPGHRGRRESLRHSVRRRPPRCSRQGAKVARSSVASSLARSGGASSGTGSALTQRAARRWVGRSPVLRRRRCRPRPAPVARTTSAGVPPGSTCSTTRPGNWRR